MSHVKIAARPTRLVSLRSPSHPPHKGEGEPPAPLANFAALCYSPAP